MTEGNNKEEQKRDLKIVFGAIIPAAIVSMIYAFKVLDTSIPTLGLFGCLFMLLVGILLGVVGTSGNLSERLLSSLPLGIALAAFAAIDRNNPHLLLICSIIVIMFDIIAGALLGNNLSEKFLYSFPFIIASTVFMGSFVLRINYVLQELRVTRLEVIIYSIPTIIVFIWSFNLVKKQLRVQPGSSN